MAIKVDFSGTNIEAVRKSPEAWAISSGESGSGDTYVKSQTPPRFAANDELNFLRFLPLLGLFAIGEGGTSQPLPTERKIEFLEISKSKAVDPAEVGYFELRIAIEKIILASEVIQRNNQSNPRGGYTPPWVQKVGTLLTAAFELADKVATDHRGEQPFLFAEGRGIKTQIWIFLANVTGETSHHISAIDHIQRYIDALVQTGSSADGLRARQLFEKYNRQGYLPYGYHLHFSSVTARSVDRAVVEPYGILALKQKSFGRVVASFGMYPAAKVVEQAMVTGHAEAKVQMRQLREALEVVRTRLVERFEKR